MKGTLLQRVSVSHQTDTIRIYNTNFMIRYVSCQAKNDQSLPFNSNIEGPGPQGP